VIFDEASQCPIEQAIPAIFRGKRLIVSGDEKQLPPTGFFAAHLEVDDENEPAEDEEATNQPVEKSALKDLIEIEDLLQGSIDRLPPAYLKVHYRSENPALIQFSNHAFYDGKLEAPPSRAGAATGKRPLLYHQIDGLYTRRTNEQEARRVVQ